MTEANELLEIWVREFLEKYIHKMDIFIISLHVLIKRSDCFGS